MCTVAANSSVWCISADGAATFVCLAAPWQPHVHLAHCGPAVVSFSSLFFGPCNRGWVLSARLQDSLWAQVQTHSHTHSKQALTGRIWMGSKRGDIVSVQTMRWLKYQSEYAGCVHMCVCVYVCVQCGALTWGIEPEGKQKEDREL